MAFLQRPAKWNNLKNRSMSLWVIYPWANYSSDSVTFHLSQSLSILCAFVNFLTNVSSIFNHLTMDNAEKTLHELEEIQVDIPPSSPTGSTLSSVSSSSLPSSASSHSVALGSPPLGSPPDKIRYNKSFSLIFTVLALQSITQLFLFCTFAVSFFCTPDYHPGLLQVIPVLLCWGSKLL